LAEKFLKNKKILITAGPVWVPIDKVRVMTNVFGGSLGLAMSLEAQKRGAKVVLLLGPGRVQLPKKIPLNLKIIRFKYFSELLSLMKKEVLSGNYDAIIHSAAVSDYTPDNIYRGKINSNRKKLTVKFKPTLKIVDLIKKWDPSIFLVKFKLEVNARKKELIEKAYRSMIKSKANLMIANDFKDVIKKHKAFIIDNNKNIIECTGKKMIAQKLFYKVKELS
jgi:phosphopantothenoylcysteine synthetase/decarboxylase